MISLHSWREAKSGVYLVRVDAKTLMYSSKRICVVLVQAEWQITTDSCSQAMIVRLLMDQEMSDALQHK
jgi:hypothetical protein